MNDNERYVWSSCSLNCGSRCALRLHVVNGQVVSVESDPSQTSDTSYAMRACLKGRALKTFLNSSLRLNYPLKRIGPRGEGAFQRISWDEAISLFAERLTYVRDTYSNQAFYHNYATGLYQGYGSPYERLLAFAGGYLGREGNYSATQATVAGTYLYGSWPECFGSHYSATKDSDLIVLFGANPAVTSISGGGPFTELMESTEKAEVDFYVVDPRYNDTAATLGAAWIHIRPGTDAALANAICYVLLEKGHANRAFLDRYCVGFSEKTLPAGAPAHASFESYLLGLGPDRTPKTPQWAEGICGTPASIIEGIAFKLAHAKRPFVSQGLGLQRRDNGEASVRAVAMIPLMLGKVVEPGTNNGLTPPIGVPFDEIPIGNNPVKLRIPVYLWTEAIAHPERLTRDNGGVLGGERLETGIKFLVNHAGNCLTNQHGDLNKTHEILRDESLCEFIVASDVVMTDSVKYADLVLPDLMRAETDHLVAQGYLDEGHAFIRGKAPYDPPYERKDAYDVCALIAQKLGFGERYTEGRTHDDWNRKFYEDFCAEHPELDAPSFEELTRKGVWSVRIPMQESRLKRFIARPDDCPLDTPTGKIEVYSQTLAQMARVRNSEDTISPILAYIPEREGVGSPLAGEYPFLLTGFHKLSHTHSSYYKSDILRKVDPHRIWINTLDAERLGVATGDMLRVYNRRGEILVEAQVTPRIIPGTLALPQGAWFEADELGIDEGANINTLTSHKASYVARGSTQHSVRVALEKVDHDGTDGLLL